MKDPVEAESFLVKQVRKFVWSLLMYTWTHAEFVSRFNGPLFTLWFPFHSTCLNLVHIKASGGINFNEFPEKLLQISFILNSEGKSGPKCLSLSSTLF